MERRPGAIRRRVGLVGVELYGHIGYYPEERKMGRLFRVEADIEYAVPEVGGAPPIDYRAVAQLIQAHFQEGGTLIEHLAERLALAVLEAWSAVESVRIRVHKVHPPIGILAESAYAEVELTRSG